MTALAIALAVIAGALIADIAQGVAWRRWVARQRARTANVLERAE